MKTFAVLGAAALITSSASATYTNLTVEVAYNVSGSQGVRDVYSVYANFTLSNDRILNLFDYANISGTMGARHNDNAFGDIDTDGDGYPDIFGATGSWSLAYNFTAGNATDTYVTVQGTSATGTALDPSFTQPFTSATIGGTNAGWYDATPGTQNTIGATLRVKVMQISRVAGDMTAYTGEMTVGYSIFGSTNPFFGLDQRFSLPIPAPGALALLGLAGFASRRRRA
ncbi:MAG: hypothetical protein EXS15_07390 [Phycisphaerales bacterium]|nr:hypothetical protein [Phycisphaerales bacterium]